MNYMLAYERFCAAKRKQNAAASLLSSKTAIVKKHKKDGLQLHHMKPRRLNGADTLSNYVLLSREDHVFAHLLLDIALCQQGKTETVKKLDYGAYLLPESFFKKNALKGLKIDIVFPGKKKTDFKTCSLKQAGFYYACIRQRDITSRDALTSSTWAVLRKAVVNGSKGGSKFRLRLPRS